MIASSDQIWNTKLNKEHTAYFLVIVIQKKSAMPHV